MTITTQTLQQQVLNEIRHGLVLVRRVLQVPLVFGHLCKGNLRKPGVLRVSSVIGDAYPGSDLGDHDTAFLCHVQRFGREKTLLNWLVNWTRAALANRAPNQWDVAIAATFLIDGESGPLVRVVKNAISSHTTLSKDLVRCLVPENLGKAYLATLYTDPMQPMLFCGRRLPELEMLAAQMQALRMLKTNVASTKAFDSLCEVYRPEGTNIRQGEDYMDADRLQLLSSLQIAYAYADVFVPQSLNSGGLVSICRPLVDSHRESHDAVPVLALSTSIITSKEVYNTIALLSDLAKHEPLSNALRMLADQLGAGVPPGTLIGKDTKFSSVTASLFVGALPKKPPFKLWADNAAKWIALLVSELQGAKHEGGPLEFTFVMGDMAQIEDSSAFERLALSDAGFEFPPDIADSEERMIDSLHKAKRTIEKENYFWFQEGRYALLWDFTFPERRPQYLLGLKDSSWHVFIDNARNRIRPATADAAQVVGYLDNRGGGGLIVGGEHVFSLSQQGVWIQRGEALSKRVEAYLKAAGTNILDAAEVETLVKALVAVSNDPNSGCMLILANGTELPPFEEMGHPWKVSPIGRTVRAAEDSEKLSDLTDEKLVAMLGMDGAACVWRKNDICYIAFRRLARPDDPGNSYTTAPIVRERLSGEGSRKWSALLAACRKDVNLVIAVSQDGPVHFYCQAKVAKVANNNIPIPFSSADNDEEVVHDRIPA